MTMNRRHIAVMLLGGFISATASAQTPTTAPATASAAPFSMDAPFAAGNQANAFAPELMLFQDMPVIVAAGKREQTQREAAASVSVISANDIELFGYRSLADVLRNQRSFYLHTDGLNWFAGVRGFERPGEWNARLLVTVDGRPTREVLFGQTHIDQDFVVPIEAIKQIEIVRGPGSALYGTNAVFGVVNVVTKDGADLNGAEVTLQEGTQNTARIAMLYGMKTADNWDIFTAITGYASEGNSDIKYDGVEDAAHNFGHVENSDYEGVESAFVKVKKGEFTIQAEYANRQKDNRSATYLASWFNPGVMHEEIGNLTLRYDHEVAPGQSLHAMAYYGYYGYRQPYFLDGVSPPTIYKTEAHDDWLGEEIHYDWQFDKKLHFLFGVDATESLRTLEKDSTTADGTVLDVSPSYNSWAIFGEGEYRFTDWLSLTTGLRLDEIEHIGSLLSPRLAMIFTPTKADAIKALYGRAFREPNLYEQTYASPGSQTPNPNLNSEVVDTYELAWERQFQSGWRTSVNGYLWKMADAINLVALPDDTSQPQNVGTVWAHGVEAEASRHFSNGASFRTYATYSVAKLHGEGLTHSPLWIVGAAFAVPVFAKNTFLSVDSQFVSGMTSDLGETTNPTYITNIVLTAREVRPGLTVQAGIYNLFGQYAHLPHDGAFDQVQPTLNYPSPRIMVGLTYRF